MSPDIQNTELLKAIEMAIPATAIEQAIANTKTEEERTRSLPAQLMVSLVITQVASYSEKRSLN
ncbi:Transposase, IS4, N-terminal [Nostoc flagelliforme CCNUN1]|uniref:Transposase, IS4, N-terminal n=1 Tax=Nostoc flagelliforme CCNUN1 TaxID=2038116 RepID=A0A2K8T3P0_9NOSO|nr:transposase domain-containing protein [Nostoc flagelliforme]AUB42317.1 Transposase, IS4, N-terminal [Nostoc flagelliforme CCNUN1]